MTQIVLPLGIAGHAQPSRIIIGSANAAVLDAFENTTAWPFYTAILCGPSRSGKSLFARWFADNGHGKAIDNAQQADETELFHQWNRAQATGEPLLLVSEAAEAAWQIKLPDLASRLGPALRLHIGAPDDKMVSELITLHAEMRGLTLGEEAGAYLVPRCKRSYAGVESLVAAIDRLSLERKSAATMAIWRDALEEVNGFEV